jgi:Anti-sigma factor NepR
MKSLRTSPTGFSPFAPPNCPESPTNDNPALPARSCQHLGTELRAFYDDILAAPVPARLAELIERLDAVAREDAR